MLFVPTFSCKPFLNLQWLSLYTIILTGSNVAGVCSTFQWLSYIMSIGNNYEIVKIFGVLENVYGIL